MGDSEILLELGLSFMTLEEGNGHKVIGMLSISNNSCVRSRCGVKVSRMGLWVKMGMFSIFNYRV